MERPRTVRIFEQEETKGTKARTTSRLAIESDGLTQRRKERGFLVHQIVHSFRASQAVRRRSYFRVFGVFRGALFRIVTA